VPGLTTKSIHNIMTVMLWPVSGRTACLVGGPDRWVSAGFHGSWASPVREDIDHRGGFTHLANAQAFPKLQRVAVPR
jgi:hypothetical protein